MKIAHEYRMFKNGGWSEWKEVPDNSIGFVSDLALAEPNLVQVRGVTMVAPAALTLAGFAEAAVAAGMLSGYEYGRCYLEGVDFTAEFTRLAAKLGITE